MDKLIIPVYLNQKLVFDLLAMLQGGISTVTAITRTNAETEKAEQNLSTNFGLSEAFSTLLKIDLSGNKADSNSKDKQNTVSEERVHTPASMFFQLRNTLEKEKHIKKFTHEVPPQEGDFIEFTGSLKRNPIIETVESFASMLEIAESFTDQPQPNKNKQKKPQLSENEKIRKQMLDLSEALKAGSTTDLTATELTSGYTAVITVETGFLNDPLMSDIVDGKFKILGKVIKTVSEESQSLSLLRKTAFSKMPDHLLQEIFGALSSFGDEEDFDIPEMIWNINGPAIQVLPIAIYA